MGVSPFDTETERLDLTVNVVEGFGQVEVRFSYSTDLFEHSTIARMVSHFQTLLQSALQNPEQPVSLLPLLTPAERDQILLQWNDTVDHPTIRCIHELVEAQVERTPNAVAVTSNDQSLTYHELNQRANQLAHHLRSLGVKPDTRVAVCVERGLDMIVAVIGILKAGGGYVPLDPAYPAERLKYMLEDSGAIALLTQRQLEGLFKGSSRSLLVIDVGDASPGWKDQPTSNPDCASIGLSLETSGLRDLHFRLYGRTQGCDGGTCECRTAVHCYRWVVSV